jgi:hypothetical protein
MTRSGFEYILSKHVKTALLEQPSLAKKHISPHSLRHSCAMHTLKATHDIRKVSLWLGHAVKYIMRVFPVGPLEFLVRFAQHMLKYRLIQQLRENIKTGQALGWKETIFFHRQSYDLIKSDIFEYRF